MSNVGKIERTRLNFSIIIKGRNVTKPSRGRLERSEFAILSWEACQVCPSRELVGSIQGGLPAALEVRAEKGPRGAPLGRGGRAALPGLHDRAAGAAGEARPQAGAARLRGAATGSRRGRVARAVRARCEGCLLYTSDAADE